MIPVSSPLPHIPFTYHPLINPLANPNRLRIIGSKAFETTIAAPSPAVTSSSGLTVKADIDYKTAHEDLHYYDVLILPGGAGVHALLSSSEGEKLAEPMPLLQAYAALQKKDSSKERTLLSIGTGSLLFAHAGLLQGLAATTHPDHYTRLENTCKDAARRGDLEQTDVMEENYVVCNARFDLGEEIDENPFVLKRPPPSRARKGPPSPSIGRKGSNAWKESVKRRESVVRRAQMKLGGLRVITSGGVTSGLDASLYLVAAMVSFEAAEEVGRVLQYSWTKGVTVEGIDV